MKKTLPRLRLLLLQVRETAKVAAHEQACFLERLDVRADDMKVVNLVESPRITWDQVRDCDVVIIGGAAAHSATEDHEFTAPYNEVVLRLIDDNRPIFGSCWGHQSVARALGGEVIADRSREEVGSFQIHLTPDGRSDPMFEGYPDKFVAHMGHHDRISRLPPGGVELACSDLCPNQVYRLKDRLVYGTQFHAEMSSQRLIERLSMYRDSYLPCDEEFEALKQNPLETPDADRILHRFLEQVADA